MKKQKSKKNKKNTDIENRMLIHFNTQYSSISPYADSTVVKTPDTVIKGSLYSKHNRFVSEEYLLNYRANNNNLGFRTGVATFFSKGCCFNFCKFKHGRRRGRYYRTSIF